MACSSPACQPPGAQGHASRCPWRLRLLPAVRRTAHGLIVLSFITRRVHSSRSPIGNEVFIELDFDWKSEQARRGWVANGGASAGGRALCHPLSCPNKSSHGWMFLTGFGSCPWPQNVAIDIVVPRWDMQ